MRFASRHRLVLIRLLLIAVLAVLTGPRPAAMAGEASVICGAGGEARAVVYDFHAGRPKPAPLGFERCDCCVACDLAAAPHAAPEAPARRIGGAPADASPTVFGLGRAPVRVAARDPPLLS